MESTHSLNTFELLTTKFDMETKLDNTKDPQHDANNVLADSFLRCDGQRYNFKKGMENCPLRETCKRWHMRQDKWYELDRLQFDTIKDFRKCKHFVGGE